METDQQNCIPLITSELHLVVPHHVGLNLLTDDLAAVIDHTLAVERVDQVLVPGELPDLGFLLL